MKNYLLLFSAILCSSFTQPDLPKKTAFDLSSVSTLHPVLSRKIVDQPEAVKSVIDALRAYKAQIHDRGKPIGCFLFIGSSGVGKTELAKALAGAISPSGAQLIRLNMSEFQGDPGLYRLIGMPKGFLESGEGGELSNALLKKPYSIVLLDEFEKAHSIVRLLFLHVFDEGYFTSSRGDLVDCTNCIFIATTNVSSSQIEKEWTHGLRADDMLEKIRPQLVSTFTPELYNRMEPVIFRNITSEGLTRIIRLKLQEASERIYRNRQIKISFDNSLVDYALTRCLALNIGARSVERIIKKEIIPSIADFLIDNVCSYEELLLVAFDGESIVVSRP